VAGANVGPWRVLKRVKAAPCQVCLVVDAAGQRGYLKYQQDRRPGRNPSYARQRFLREAEVMQRLRGQPGILPLLDVDSDAHPSWFVTEEAVLLDAHFGPGDRDFREVVQVFAHLASTLATLHDEAVVGDFGIAGIADADLLGLTDAGRKQGPWGYIAPEALNNENVRYWKPADVYSLIKCFWKIAQNKNYPPQGTLYIREEGTTLFPVGGAAGIELARLLEVGTAPRPQERPRMSVVRDELLAWLLQHAAGTVNRPDKGRAFQYLATTYSQRRADEQGIEGIAAESLFAILNPLRGARSGSTSVADAEGADIEASPAIIHMITGGDPDWEAEFSATKALTWVEHPRLRVIAQAIGQHDFATYLAQWQTRAHDEADWIAACPVQTAQGTLGSAARIGDI
jgi:hypothetical protein